MKKVYLAVGHGRKPDGTFDPGAVAPDGVREYDVARAIARAAQVVLSASRDLEVRCEWDQGATMDPNYKGSVAQVNGWEPDVAVSVHLDWHKAPRGGFGLYTSASGKRVADHIAKAWADAGLPQRLNDERDDLYFLNKTSCPAVIWESDRVGADVATDEYVERMGHALASGICAALGVAAPREAVDYEVAVVYDATTDGRDKGAAAVLARAGDWVLLPLGHAERVRHAIFVGKAASVGNPARYESSEDVAGPKFYEPYDPCTVQAVLDRIKEMP